MIPALVALARRALDLGHSTPESAPQGAEHKSVLRLDGVENRNTVRFGDRAVEQVSQTIWDGRTLQVKSSVDLNGRSIETTLAIGLDAARQLVVDVTAPGMDGAMVTTRHGGAVEERRKAG